MRRVWISLARRTPSRVTTNRVMPWITLALAALGASWSILQYTNGVAIQRSNTTFTILRQYVATFPDGTTGITGLSDEALIAQVLQIRCTVYEEAMSDGRMPANDTLPICATVTLADHPRLIEIGKDQPDSVRAQIRDTIDATILLNGGPARRMMTYFRSLHVCVESNHCDREIAAELFKADIVAFLNLTCALARTDPPFKRQSVKLDAFAQSLPATASDPLPSDLPAERQSRCAHLRQ